MLKRIVCLLAVMVAPFPLFAQRDFSTVEIKSTHVAGSVYMLEGAGGNIGLSVGSDGVVVIDDQYAPLAPKIREAIAKISDKPVRFILNTHFHGDHTGGNEYFGQSAPVIAHHNVRKRLEAQVGAAENPVSPKALPIVTFGHDLSIFLNGEEVRAIHVGPGHTDGDSIIYFTKSNVVHMGDDFFNGFFPFIDLDSGGSVSGMIAAVDNVIATVPADAKIIAGHGPLGTVADLRKYSAMLKETSSLVRAAKQTGKTVEQVKSDKPLKPWDSWAWRVVSSDAFVETLYRDTAVEPRSRSQKH